MASAFDDLLAPAWADHADRSVAVAQRLRTDTPAPESPQRLAALARFVADLRVQHARGAAPARARDVAAAEAAFEKLSSDDRAARRTTLDDLKALGT